MKYEWLLNLMWVIIVLAAGYLLAGLMFLAIKLAIK